METGEGTGGGMNDLKIFENPEFGKVRTVAIDGEPWFVLKDVCEVFGEANYRRVAARLDEDEKGVSQIATPGGNQSMTIVNEPGLYSALFTMQPEKARGVSDEYIKNRIKQLKAFKRWITHEVIPSIRKTGSYTKPESVQLVTPAPPELSLSGLASTARVARRAMLDIGASRWDAGMEVLSILGYYGLPVPGFIPKKDPGMIRLEDFFK